jgi:hypothetical protein
MKHNLELVTLNDEQIKKAKEVHGARKQITHALICGPYGQIFGTEKYCRKYYSAWMNVFPLLFRKSIETGNKQISEFESTFDLVNKLIAIHNPLEKENNPSYEDFEKNATKSKQGFFAKLFGKNS